MKKIIFIAILLTISFGQNTPGVDPISARVMPKPKNYTYGSTDLLITDPCGIIIRPATASGVIPSHVNSIIDFYTNQTFSSTESICAQKRESYKNETALEKIIRLQNSISVVFDIYIQDATLDTANTVEDEYYNLQIYNTTNWGLTANKYVGLLRGLETFSQLFVLDEDTYSITLKNIPISIQDKPDYPYRGLMIDSARTFLSVATILQTIDAMLFNKLNVLHWHITDNESFPYLLKSNPNITLNGAFSKKKIYSADDIKLIVDQALFKGIQVIPEVDTPSHTFSWIQSPQFAQIGMWCDSFNGQLDPTLDQTYSVVKGIMQDMSDQFYSAKYVHFGGDEVDEDCWKKIPKVKTFMKKNNLADYTDLQNYYRSRQMSIWKTINSTRSRPAIYWADSNNLDFQPDDIIQWWGSSKDIVQIKELPNKIILSFVDTAYINVGGGNSDGTSDPIYFWGVINSFNPRVTGIKGQVIGGESCLWSEMNSSPSQSTTIWTRNSAFAERLWNTDAANNDTFKTRALVSRMAQMYRRLNYRGIPASPVTEEICIKNMDKCYSN